MLLNVVSLIVELNEGSFDTETLLKAFCFSDMLNIFNFFDNLNESFFLWYQFKFNKYLTASEKCFIDPKVESVNYGYIFSFTCYLNK